MAEEILVDKEKYQMMVDELSIGETTYKGLRTFILALVALFGYIGAVYLPSIIGSPIDGAGLFTLTEIAFAAFFVKSVIDMKSNS